MVAAVREVAIREIAVQDPAQALDAVLAFIEDEEQSLPLAQVDGVLAPSRVWVTTLGFQLEMGLEGLRAAAQPAQPAARLDKGGTSPHFLSEPYPGEGVQTTLWWDSRWELRGHHAGITRLLRSMKTGEHGLAAQAIAEKSLHDVERCPGVRRRHGPCGLVSFEPYSCDFPLCPWCQHRRSDKARRKLSKAVGLLQEPMLITLNPPNLAEFTSGAVAGLIKVFTSLRREKVFKDVRGGVRSVETTLGRNGWNLHVHALVDSPWIAQHPQWDIKRGKGRWLVVKKHPGLAREFTIACQKFPELRSPRLDFDRDNPDHWYFVDLRRADSGAVAEVVKYIAKGSEVVGGGPGAVVAFLGAIKGRRMIQPFGSLYDVDLEGEELADEFDVSARGECPYDDCPAPAACEWSFVQFGPGDNVLDRDARIGSYRELGLAPLGRARDGPGPGAGDG